VYFILCFGFGFLLFASELCFNLEVRHHLEQIMLFDLCVCGSDSYGTPHDKTLHKTYENLDYKSKNLGIVFCGVIFKKF
jgi:hypothetical protein